MHVEYSVAKWARFFQVSRGGYYAYIQRRTRLEEEKKARMFEIKRIFDESGGAYGPERINGVLRKNGGKASYKKTSSTWWRWACILYTRSTGRAA